MWYFGQSANRLKLEFNSIYWSLKQMPKVSAA